MEEDPFLFRLNGEPAAVPSALYNMIGDYTYLSAGYYHSMDYELEGVIIRPSTEEVLDAYVVPLAMKKAEKAGIKVPKYEIAGEEEVSPPVLAYPINPFSKKFVFIEAQAEAKAKIRAVTMGGKYAALCQNLPRDYQITEFFCILGMAVNPLFRQVAKDLYTVFRLPLMKIRIIQSGKDLFFSAIEPVVRKELSMQERILLEANGKWQE